MLTPFSTLKIIFLGPFFQNLWPSGLLWWQLRDWVYQRWHFSQHWKYIIFFGTFVPKFVAIRFAEFSLQANSLPSSFFLESKDEYQLIKVGLRFNHFDDQDLTLVNIGPADGRGPWGHLTLVHVKPADGQGPSGQNTRRAQIRSFPSMEKLLTHPIMDTLPRTSLLDV